MHIPDWAVATGLITWLVSIWGWIVTSRDANARESRKEYRSALDGLEADIDRLLAAYLTYLTEDAAIENEQARIRIHSELNRLLRHVESIEVDVGSEVMEHFGELYEAITSGDFESKARKKSNAGRDHGVAAICAERLIDCCETWFRKKYLKQSAWKFFKLWP